MHRTLLSHQGSHCYYATTQNTTKPALHPDTLVTQPRASDWLEGNPNVSKTRFGEESWFSPSLCFKLKYTWHVTVSGVQQSDSLESAHHDKCGNRRSPQRCYDNMDYFPSSVYYIPMPFISDNWRFAPFIPLHPFHSPFHPAPLLWQPSVRCLYLWVCFWFFVLFIRFAFLFFRFYIWVNSCDTCLFLQMDAQKWNGWVIR